MSAFCAALYADLAPAQDAPTQLDPVTVTDSADYFRNRSDSVAPRLIYESEFFSRFEPLSVGDMLKQVPGVAFTSDIGEYDAPQLRGIGTEYTQVLINGQRVAGAENDRGVFVDRIPAELVERIEIIRSPQADLDSQGVGGSINIVLKNVGGYSGGQYRIGGFLAGEGTLRGSGYLGYGGQSGPWSYLGSVNLQQRYNPKDKHEQLFDTDGNLLAFAQEDDIRDTTDTSLNGALSYLFGSGASLGFEGYFVGTDRDEDQFSPNFEVVDGVAELDVIEFEHERIDEQSYGLGTRFRQPFAGDGEWVTLLNFNRLALDIANEAGEVDEGEVPLERENVDTTDDELRLGSSLLWGLGEAHRLKVGVQLARKERDSTQRLSEFDEDEGEFTDATEANGIYAIREDRADLFAQDTWTVGPVFALDFGVRVEHTMLDQEGFDSDSNPRTASDDQTDFNPNLHARWSVGRNDQVRASVARTVRRPNFNDLVPFLIEDDEEFFVGNPALEPESAIGYDLGYEHRFARQAGILGFNVFYRDVSDLIEVVEVADNTTSPSNTGDGTVYGVEFDASLPLVALGLPGVNVYGNYTYLKSEVTDPFSGIDRRFQNQPIYVANVGFTHKLPSLRLTWGASFQHQGKSLEYASDEIASSEYDGNLEAFVEYKFTERLSLKLNGNNLLDSELKEVFQVFDDDLPDGQLEEIERETESIGRIVILTLRGSF
jgi:outer membrane receptor protein involved in Fe transport